MISEEIEVKQIYRIIPSKLNLPKLEENIKIVSRDHYL